MSPQKNVVRVAEICYHEAGIQEDGNCCVLGREVTFWSKGICLEPTSDWILHSCHALSNYRHRLHCLIYGSHCAYCEWRSVENQEHEHFLIISIIWLSGEILGFHISLPKKLTGFDKIDNLMREITFWEVRVVYIDLTTDDWIFRWFNHIRSSVIYCESEWAILEMWIFYGEDDVLIFSKPKPGLRVSILFNFHRTRPIMHASALFIPSSLIAGTNRPEAVT